MSTPNEAPAFLTTQQVAAVFGVTQRRLAVLVQVGRLEASRCGRGGLIPAPALEAVCPTSLYVPHRVSSGLGDGGSADGTTFQRSAPARTELHRRGIPETLLAAALAEPEQNVPGHRLVWCDQSRVTLAGKPYLLRVMVDETQQPLMVVTVYRTSKIDKYWSHA
jgi:hypothetical protein